jgi:hypothetical protein
MEEYLSPSPSPQIPMASMEIHEYRILTKNLYFSVKIYIFPIQIDIPTFDTLECIFKYVQIQIRNSSILIPYTMFGSREIRRKESGRRERLKNILFSIVWLVIKKERKESF